MNQQKLDAIEKLISYSGLESRQARDYLEKASWNVDVAYRQFKNAQMAHSPFQGRSHPQAHPQPQPQQYHAPPTHQARPLNTRQVVNPSKPAPTVTTGRQQVPFAIPIQHYPANKPQNPIKPMAYAKPTTESYSRPQMSKNYHIEDGLGMAMTGMGPAVGVSLHPAFQQLEPVPKFPVEAPKERTVPIQIERAPPTQPRTTSMAGTSVPRPEALPKSQSYPVQVKVEHQSNRPADDNTQPRTSFVIGDKFATERGSNPVPGSQGKEAGVRKSSFNDPQLSPPKPLQTPISPKTLKRGISKISQNASLVDEERKNVLHDIAEDCHDNMYIQTFVLPDISGYNDELREFLERDLIEMSTLVSLEQAGRLNWWAELGVCQRLWPMATTGDGNCLLHAASLAMWGIHDRQLLLRKALYSTLTEKYYREALYRRWRLQQTYANQQAGLIFSEEEWKQEWENVLRLASTTPRCLPGVLNRKNSCCDSPLTHNNCDKSTSAPSKTPRGDSPVVYESLEEVHVFVLAHVIQRPIIVVADTILRDANGQAMAPIPFGGIYLPVECDPSHCYRSPLLLTYDAAHFSALVPMDTKREEDEERSSLPIAIPIVSSELKTLPLHFAIDPGLHFNWEKSNGTFSMTEENKINLLKKYLDVEKLPICGAMLDNNSDKNSTGSYESDDGLIEKGKKKDKKNIVSKQFGSFGKSVGKKLKNLGKGAKEDKKGSGSRNSNLIQNSRIPLTISALADSDQQTVYCCKLTMSKSDTHQKMVDNYLFDAGERFKSEMSSPRVRRKENGPGRPQVPCVTNGCTMYGTVDRNYLCSKCYDDQKRAVVDREKDRSRDHDSRKHNKHGKDDVDATKIGKSKFYDMKNEDSLDKVKGLHIESRVTEPPKSLLVDLNPSKGDNSNKTVPRTRARTPSPDYDNISRVAMPIKPTVNKPVLSQIPAGQRSSQVVAVSGKKCITPDCSFFGAAVTGNYCSSCYKKKDLRQV